MKKYAIFYMGLGLASLTLAGCADLDTAPESDIATSDQKTETSEANPDRAEAGVNGIFSQMKAYMPNKTALGRERHNDIGYPFVMMATDANGIDMVSADNGYNWAGNNLLYNDRTYTSYDAIIMWNTLYQQVFTCNNLVAGIDSTTTNATWKFYRAQGLAVRAFNYHVLAQLYQFNYVGHENSACVPLITDANQQQARDNGIKRSTVKEVYAQILKDLDEAIKLLEDSKVSRKNHNYVSAAVAYGLRARVYLTMQKWAEAASDADKAITLAAEENIYPLSMDDVKRPGFYDYSQWLWGVRIDESDNVVVSGIVNWISHNGTLNYGYASYSGGRQISKKLYNEIPSTDVRKGWWTNADNKSANLTDKEAQYVVDNGFPPYTQVKFGPDQGTLNQQTNANDIILMRVEEMYLIKAEATAMAGNVSEGAKVLTDFVKTYRDPSYSLTASTKEEVQEAVWQQRRIELWGEGMSWFDLMRLNKPVDRRGAGFATPLVYDITPGSDILLWRIPQTEMAANPMLKEDSSDPLESNNPSASRPTAVADN